MKYQTYPNYKPSGVEWLGDVPEHWGSIALKRNFNIVGGSTPKSEQEIFWDGEIIWVTPSDLSKLPSLFIDDSQRKITVNGLFSCGTTLVPKDSIILSTRAPIGSIAIAGKELCTNQGCKSLVPIHKAKAKFFGYLLSVSSTELNIRGRGTTFLELSGDELGNFKVPFPPLPEQQKIAQFLDHETAKIDTLIDKQQRLIALLKEKRQAVISHAVTKGLNPNAPMKDSGVEWLGDVPVGWEVRMVAKSSNKITNGYVGQTKDILVDEGVPYIQATHIKRGKVNFDGAYFVRQNWSDAHSKSILSKGDVLIVQTGAGTGDIGLVTEKEEGFNCHALIIIEPVKKLISGDFLSMVLQSQYGYSKLYSIRTGGMHPHLNCGEVQFVKLPIPPRNEQDEIMNYIECNVRTDIPHPIIENLNISKHTFRQAT